jgi:hypothetical protein
VATRAKAVRKTTATLLLIALFKLIRGILLLAVGIGALKLLHRDVAQTVAHWVDILRVDPGNRLIHRLLSRVLALTASSALCDPGTRLKSGDSEASTHGKDEDASDAIQKPESESKCHRREFPSSSRARNSANCLVV